MTRLEPQKPRLLTVGHSDHAVDYFVQLLKGHEVTAIADVRSRPYSGFAPQFNRDAIAASLKSAGIKYVFLGAELGARRDERSVYRDGQAKYALIRLLPSFRAGLERISRGLAEQRIALMCSERDPITCHRTVLVCRSLRGTVDTAHILADGSLETCAEAESRLLSLAGLAESNLFIDRDEMVERAYDKQAERIAFRETDPPD